MAKSNSLNQYNPMQSALALLQPTVSYAQKRADAMQNLAIQGAITQQNQQQLEVAKQQALLSQQAQAQLMNVPFLERDQKQWVAEIDRQKAKMRQRADDEFGGDPEEYARVMLPQDQQQLALEMQKSSFYTAALERRSNYLQAQKDAADGKIYRPVQYKTVDGKTKVAPFDQAYLDFHNGDTDELPYRGGFKVDGKWQKLITENYSPRVDKLGKYKTDFARPDEILSALTVGEGLSGEDAAEYYRRTAPMLGNLHYKTEAVDPFEVERVKQGWANVALGKERNQLTRERNQTLKKQAAMGQMDWWDATFNNLDNVITRTKDGSPGTIPATFFTGDMKQGPSIALVGITGKVVGPSLLESTGAVFDKKKNTYQGAGGPAYVAVKNQAGGIDLRQTDLTGLTYTTKPGNVYRYLRKPTEYERATNRQPYELMQEQIVLISSDEARKGASGELFRGVLNLGKDFSSGFNPFGNADTPTGKGAYRDLGEHEGEDGKKHRYYEFRILQPVKPTAIDRMQPTMERLGTQNQTGQAAMYDADDDLRYIPGFNLNNIENDD